jgi:hypothetical protein
MLTFKDEGRTIAKVIGGKKNGEIISITSNEDDIGDTSFIPKHGKIEPIPSLIEGKPSREIIYIAGPSGAGKSTWVAMYIKNFKKLFPNSKVYMFSRLEEDDSLKKQDKDITRIELNRDLIDDPIDIHNEGADGSLFVFDDCDTIQDQEIKNAVMNIQRDVLETGRHKNLYCMITSHLIKRPSRNDNNTIFNEMHRLVIFPHGGNRTMMENILEQQFGLEKRRIKKILTNKSRWLCFGKNYPMYCMWDRGIHIL